MIRKNISILVLLLAIISASAQIKPGQFKPFIGNQEIIDSSGPGLTQSSGDILLQLKEPDDPDMINLLLLRRINGKLKKIAENYGLLMGSGMLGVSGGGYAGINDGGELFVDYWLGSTSAVSNVSVVFEKSNDGSYYFKEYTSKTNNYGVEDLFGRNRITAEQTGKMDFLTTSENDILKKAKAKTAPVDSEEPLYKAADQYKSYIPEGFRLAAFSKGDLNLDGFKNDLLLVLYNEEVCSIRLLLQQNNGTYKLAESNTQLIIPDETFNINNIKVAIKNGFFTVERRVATDDNDFDHRYITFKYNAAQKNWLLHRFDVTHFKGFNPKPSKEVTHLTTKEFGSIAFSKMADLPGVYRFEPELSMITGTIVIKQFYGAPNYGKTPEKDDIEQVYILQTDYPVSVFDKNDSGDPEIGNHTTTNISEIQAYSVDKNIDLKNQVNKKTKLEGVFQAAFSGHHHTKVLLEVKKILQ